MSKKVFGRFGVLVVAGIATSAIVAAFALAAGGPPSQTPPTSTGTPAGQLSLNGAAAFPVSSFQWGAGVAVSGSVPPVISDPSISEITVSRLFDGNSIVLLNALVGKTVFPTAKLTATWGSGATLVYDMKDLVISGHSTSSGGGQPSESDSLNFSKLKWTYTDATGTKTGQYPLP